MILVFSIDLHDKWWVLMVELKGGAVNERFASSDFKADGVHVYMEHQF